MYTGMLRGRREKDTEGVGKRLKYEFPFCPVKTTSTRSREVEGLSVHGLANTMTIRTRVRLSTPKSSRQQQRGNPQFNTTTTISRTVQLCLLWHCPFFKQEEV